MAAIARKIRFSISGRMVVANARKAGSGALRKLILHDHSRLRGELSAHIRAGPFPQPGGREGESLVGPGAVGPAPHFLGQYLHGGEYPVMNIFLGGALAV